MPGAVRAFFDFLAKMGLSIRDDPPKTLRLEGREWGAERDGLLLSASSEPGAVSVVLRNVSADVRAMRVPEFSAWFELDVRNRQGEPASQTPFGSEIRRVNDGRLNRDLELAPGAAVEAQIPIQSVYYLNSRDEYHVTAGCVLPSGGRLVSNTIVFSTKI